MLSLWKIILQESITPSVTAAVSVQKSAHRRLLLRDNTKNIFIEAAIFDAFSITKTSTRLNLKSEASKRYGKGLNFEYTISAMDRCLSLLEEYAQGEYEQKVNSGIDLFESDSPAFKIQTIEVQTKRKLIGLIRKYFNKELFQYNKPYINPYSVRLKY